MIAENSILTQLEGQRKALRMSRRVLAERCGLTPFTVERILRGKTSASFSKLSAIAEVLGAEIGIVRFSKPSAVRKREARKKASMLTGLAQGSAALESQAVDEKILRTALRKVESELLAGPPLRLWG